jgi:hypothetical protein
MEPRRGMSPRIAAKNKWGRIEALRRLKAFTKTYKKALKLWCARRGFSRGHLHHARAARSEV